MPNSRPGRRGFLWGSVCDSGVGPGGPDTHGDRGSTGPCSVRRADRSLLGSITDLTSGRTPLHLTPHTARTLGRDKYRTGYRARIQYIVSRHWGSPPLLWFPSSRRQGVTSSKQT
ncbi:hypothetical protein ACOMHN_004590 [Nucella lapillus]